MASQLLNKLRGIQAAERFTDKEMAELLNVSRATWQATRCERIPLGKKMLHGVSMTFPELRDDVIYFLSGDDHNSSDGDKDSTSTFVSRFLRKIRLK